MSDILHSLQQSIDARRNADPKSSYVASLHAKGLNHILKKLGEEAAETLIAAKDTPLDSAAVIYETADLWFHSMVMLSHLGLSAEQVLAELERRAGVSGLAEKAARSVQG